MSRTTEVLSFSLPPELAKKIRSLAKKGRRSKSELLREMISVYEEMEAESDWQDLYAFGSKTAKRYNIKNEDELFKILNKTG